MNTNTAKNLDPHSKSDVIRAIEEKAEAEKKSQKEHTDIFSGRAFRVVEGGLSFKESSDFVNQITAAIEEAIGKSDSTPKGTEPLDYRKLASPNIKRMPTYDELVQFVLKAIVRHRQEKPEEIVDKDRLIRATTKGFRYKGIDLSDEVIESIVEEAIETHRVQQNTRKKVSNVLPLGVVGQQRDAA